MIHMQEGREPDEEKGESQMKGCLIQKPILGHLGEDFLRNALERRSSPE